MTVQIIVGEALEKLRTLPDNSVHMLLSSPPYFGLRDYGTATWEGGDPAHDHDRVPARNGRGGSGSPGKNIEGAFPSDLPAEVCSCGAVRVDHQIGLEETPEEFVAKLVEVFREARRVLRDDGVAFVNIGDSYAGSGRGKGDNTGVGETAREASVTKGAGQSRIPRGSQLPAGYHEEARQAGTVGRAWVPPPAGLKQKDLIGIPWMLAFALRADGWYLRQEIIWAKPNPMPESVRDRCTKSHEHVFLLSKSQRYYYDADAIAEAAAFPEGPGNKTQKYTAVYEETGDEKFRTKAGLVDIGPRETRNKRDVWTIATEPSSIPHYAMMPTELARTCILAGSPIGGTVLDPFGGAGTTGLVADRLQRSAILIELSPEHAETARQRLAGEMGLFTDVETL